MPMGKGTYGSKVGRPSKAAKAKGMKKKAVKKKTSKAKKLPLITKKVIGGSSTR